MATNKTERSGYALLSDVRRGIIRRQSWRDGAKGSAMKWRGNSDDLTRRTVTPLPALPSRERHGSGQRANVPAQPAKGRGLVAAGLLYLGRTATAGLAGYDAKGQINQNKHMKIFNKTENWSTKVNFVDDNNVVLGYDTDQSCCEHADWFIADSPTEKILAREDTPIGTPEEMEGWNFDTAYFKRVDYIATGSPDYEYNELDSGGMVIFRIVKDGNEKFIHLFNSHNGYYGHGFDFRSGNEVINEGGI